MTDKRLLRELIHDRKLMNYSVLIVDEVHQRTVSTDLLLGFLRDLVETRSDLKVIISGVFPDDADEIVGYFNYAPVLKIKDLTSFVEMLYLNKLVPDYINSAISKVLEIHVAEPSGDILVFLQGQDEVELAEAVIKHRVLLDNGFRSV
ncbi:putative ATP-dependent RNA helicase dhx33 [Ranunculus cassubicifolius]